MTDQTRIEQITQLNKSKSGRVNFSEMCHVLTTKIMNSPRKPIKNLSGLESALKKLVDARIQDLKGDYKVLM